MVFASTSFGNHPYHFIDALVQIHQNQHFWVGSPGSWAPKTHNLDGQFLSLVDHLFRGYPVPEFLQAAWFRKDRRAKSYRQWWFHLAQGKNIRTADLPIPFTKKMAHLFMQAPSQLSIEHAIQWTRITAMNGDNRLIEAVLASRIGTELRHAAFWDTVFHFFIRHPFLDRRQVGPIIDFICAEKFAVRECVTGPGVVEIRQPPNPNFSMKGRTPSALLRQVDAWHGELNRANDIGNLFFRKSGICGYQQTTGKGKRDTWRIRQLLSGTALLEEGRQMRHCVASYAPTCAKGSCSIWTMEYLTPKTLRKHLTIEVNRAGMVVQCRGSFNRYPTETEMHILKHWSRNANLTLSPYLVYSR